ncbi:MAG: DNA polymerase IV [Coriobacteriia bacterium]|nr:DNA polymerase IV [Coriobacteriia bacterium]
MHVDMDAFFAAVEQLDHPEWRGQPVIVGGDPAKRGVVMAASYETRAFGVRSAMPAARAAVLCPDAVWARPRGARYRELSQQVRAIFSAVTPHVQPTSIDEAYLDVTPGEHTGDHPLAIAREIQSRVDALGISCSIGVAANKVVAKIASDRDKPHGITVVWPGEEAAFLAPLPCKLMPGVGSVTAARLSTVGIRDIGDLGALDELTARELLGSSGLELVARARGVDSRAVRENPPAKSVSSERTFARDVHSADEVRAAIAALAEKVALRLKDKGISGRTVTLKIRYGDFTTRTLRHTLVSSTDRSEELLETALDLLDRAWSPGVGVRLLGVGASGLEERTVQLDLFDEEREHGSVTGRLARGIEDVRRRFGADAIAYGHQPPADFDTPSQGHDVAQQGEQSQ